MRCNLVVISDWAEASALSIVVFTQLKAPSTFLVERYSSCLAPFNPPFLVRMLSVRMDAELFGPYCQIR